MIERDIRALDAREAERNLEQLEADIWARVAARAAVRQPSAPVLALQVTLLGIAFGLSVLAGYRARAAHTSELSVFSTNMPMNPSTLLAEGNP